MLTDLQLSAEPSNVTISEPLSHEQDRKQATHSGTDPPSTECTHLRGRV